MKKNFDEQLELYRSNIETCLQEAFRWPAEPQQILFEAMRYSLLAGGKRIRPVLVQAFCDLCGGESETALAFGAGVEMVHTYSLIHDDLPCMDNDDFRRGRPTSHRVYGEANAVLAGDALLTAAFGALTRSSRANPGQVVRAVQILSGCAGECGMVGGQVLDISAEDRLCTEQEVLDIQNRKTGTLIEAACLLGVVAGQGDETFAAAAKIYARSIGLSFQILDDVLDVVGDAGKLGKATGADGSKNTFVRLYGVDACRERIRQETERAVSALDGLGDTDFLITLARKLAARDH